MKKLLVALISTILFLSTALYATPKVRSYFEQQEIKQINQETLKAAQDYQVKVDQLPEKAYLEVDFISQAPLQTEANWVLHEESCEEAAFLQAYNYEAGITVSKEEANEIILDMISWQEKHLGGHKDLYADKMKKFITGYQGLEDEEVQIIYEADIRDIKVQIAAGHPVIVPITGAILDNPYYPYPGYHMLTVIGYTEDRIITNDNGTRRGANFSYDIDTFEKAFKDTGGDIIILNIHPTTSNTDSENPQL